MSTYGKPRPFGAVSCLEPEAQALLNTDIKPIDYVGVLLRYVSVSAITEVAAPPTVRPLNICTCINCGFLNKKD